MHILQLAFAFVAVVLFPALGNLRLLRYRQNLDRPHMYKRGIMFNCCAAVIAVALHGPGNPFTIENLPGVADYFQRDASHVLFLIEAGALFLAFLVPSIRTALNPRFRDRVTNATRKAAFNVILPATPSERGLFALFGSAAGIGEEIVYRSFLLTFLCAGFFHFSVLVGSLVASLLFGLDHFYQGKYMFRSFVVGLVMCFLYFVTGNLLLPILAHVLNNLQVLYVLKPDWNTSEPSHAVVSEVPMPE